MRNAFAFVCEVSGASSVAIGAFLVAPAAGFIVSGLFALAFARGLAKS